MLVYQRLLVILLSKLGGSAAYYGLILVGNSPQHWSCADSFQEGVKPTEGAQYAHATS